MRNNIRRLPPKFTNASWGNDHEFRSELFDTGPVPELPAASDAGLAPDTQIRRKLPTDCGHIHALEPTQVEWLVDAAKIVR